MVFTLESNLAVPLFLMKEMPLVLDKRLEKLSSIGKSLSFLPGVRPWKVVAVTAQVEWARIDWLERRLEQPPFSGDYLE